MKHPLKLDAAIQMLREQRDLCVTRLRDAPGDAAILNLKRQIDHAIRCLHLCEHHQIHPDSTVVTLPWPRDHFGEFAIVETNEMGDPASWNPVQIHEEPVTLNAGDIVIRMSHGFNLPTDLSGSDQT